MKGFMIEDQVDQQIGVKSCLPGNGDLQLGAMRFFLHWPTQRGWSDKTKQCLVNRAVCFGRPD